MLNIANVCQWTQRQPVPWSGFRKWDYFAHTVFIVQVVSAHCHGNSWRKELSFTPWRWWGCYCKNLPHARCPVRLDECWVYYSKLRLSCMETDTVCSYDVIKNGRLMQRLKRLLAQIILRRIRNVIRSERSEARTIIHSICAANKEKHSEKASNG